MHHELARALAFEEAMRERCAERVVPFRYGRALFNDTFASVWDLNVLRVDEPESATAEALAVEAERLHAAAGQRHRRVAVPDEEAGARLEAGFRTLGWEADRFVLMAWRGGGERGGDTTIVEEVEAAAQRPLRERTAALEPWADSDETVRMVLDAGRLVSRAGRGRHFAVKDGGEVVSVADLYSDGRTAQVEDVVTSPEHRGRGYASAVVLTAVAEATRTGHDLVFLVADDADWPKELYARLGFAPLGRKWTFLRLPARAAPE
ncbi:MAG TPA: GNAT family N-acetyltransferase [Gaiellaceae bacterium]|nr:GNAT family N-acetyltransferase [Gaiellaceae bacterium]